MVTAFLEVIERDALQMWRASSIDARSRDRVAARSIPYAWFRELSDRIRAVGLRLAVHRLRAVIGLPVFVSELIEHREGLHYRRALGAACRPSPEDALLRCVVEAAQSRLTEISGARDDMLYCDLMQRTSTALGFSLPAPSHESGLCWEDIEADYEVRPAMCAFEFADMLAAAGYPDASIVDLSRPTSGVHVVKAVVPGLAAFERNRRAPLR